MKTRRLIIGLILFVNTMCFSQSSIDSGGASATVFVGEVKG